MADTNYDQCIRIDAADGTEEAVPISRAYEMIEGAYIDAQPVKDLLHDGHRVRTGFASYELRRVVC